MSVIRAVSMAKFAGSAAHEAPKVKIPIPKKTGNELVDQEQMALFQCLQEMTDIFMQDKSHVMPMYSKLKARTGMHAAIGSSINGQFFDKISCIGQLPEEWQVMWICSHSDMTNDDLIKCKQMDSDSISQCVTFATQLPPQLRLHAQCRSKEVMSLVLHSRAAELGSRMDEWKKDKGIFPDGSIDWSKGCCSLTFDKGLLVKVTHNASNCSEIVTDRVADDHNLVENWSDWSAALVEPPFPPLKLHLLFGVSKHGPYEVPAMSGKAKARKDLVEACACDVEAPHQDEKLKQDTSSSAKEKLMAMTNKKRGDAFKQARDQAKVVLAEKKQRQIIQVN